jgi:putative transposase
MSGSSHVFSEVLLHANWHCHRDEPLITPAMEPPLHQFLEEYCRKIKGVHLSALGGTETHIHLAFQAEPFVPVSDFIGKIKRASAHEMNERFGAGSLRWQRGYGLVSFAKRNLPAVCRYVLHQREHHARQTLKATLEASGDEKAEG